jgi:hypothetical protein
MPQDRLMKICLTCDHCRIKFFQEDLEIVSGDEKNLDLRIRQLFNRDRIADIWCARGVIKDTDGVPRVYHSLTALKSAENIEGDCPFYCGEEDETDCSDE